MTAGHWNRLRAKGGGPRGGGGGHDKGPLRKVVRHRKLYTVSALPAGRCYTDWRAWQELLVTEDGLAAMNLQRRERDSCQWSEVRVTESGWREVLECGHDQLPVRDLVGETNAVRRRCAKCKAGKPQDVAATPTAGKETTGVSVGELAEAATRAKETRP